MQEFIQHYGYLAILAGTFLEGELTLLLGAVAAQAGLLELPWVLAGALGGALASDQLWFLLGRGQGGRLLRRFPAWEGRVERLHQRLERWQSLLILGFRFLYGTRTVAPVVIGMGPVSHLRYSLLNATGVLAWVLAVGGAGYLLAGAASALAADMRGLQLAFTAVLGLGLAAAFWWRRAHRREET